MPVDLCATPWLRAPMDANHLKAPQAIYTQIGMIMEDAAIIALKLGGAQPDPDPADIKELEKAVEEIVQLIGAAHSLAE